LALGILTDTMSLTRGATELDFATFEELLPLLDKELLGRLRSPAISPDTLDTLARAIIHMDTSEAERLPGVRVILTGRRYPTSSGSTCRTRRCSIKKKFITLVSLSRSQP